MCTAFRCCNVIYKSICVIAVRVIVLHCNLYCDTVFFTFTVNNLLIKRCLTFIQILHKLFNSAFVVESLLNRLFRSFIFQDNLQIFCQKCHLTETLFQRVIIKHCLLKNLFVWKKCNLCSCLLCITFIYNL